MPTSAGVGLLLNALSAALCAAFNCCWAALAVVALVAAANPKLLLFRDIGVVIEIGAVACEPVWRNGSNWAAAAAAAASNGVCLAKKVKYRNIREHSRLLQPKALTCCSCW